MSLNLAKLFATEFFEQESNMLELQVLRERFINEGPLFLAYENSERVCTALPFLFL
jgi:hypothetical protein